MPRTFTQKISVEELESKIEGAWKEHWDFDEQVRPYYNCLTKTVRTDLSKVNFNNENRSAGGKYRNYGVPEIIGYHTLDNGLSYLGVCASGDWEHPVFFMLYWDGSELRGYVPKEGNPWNTDTKAAYGNDEESDPKNLVKRGLTKNKKITFEDIFCGKEKYFDVKKITEDITKRIVCAGCEKIKTAKKVKSELKPSSRKKQTLKNTSTLDKLIIEPKAFGQGEPEDPTNPTSMKYNESQERIVLAGFQRHWTFAEQMTLLIDWVEKKNLSSDLTELAEYVDYSSGEFCNQAFETVVAGSRKMLVVYEGITRLDWNGRFYNRNSLKYSGSKKVFDISELDFGYNEDNENFNKTHPDIVSYFYTRPFDQLPEVMRENMRFWYVPDPGEIWPIRKSEFDAGWSPEAAFGGAASRGISQT